MGIEWSDAAIEAALTVYHGKTGAGMPRWRAKYQETNHLIREEMRAALAAAVKEQGVEEMRRFHTWIQETVLADARADALEEAAKAAETLPARTGRNWGVRVYVAEEIAAAIRALKDA
jgi:hypothetical protein